MGTKYQNTKFKDPNKPSENHFNQALLITPRIMAITAITKRIWINPPET
jgi:hypothetical protein